MGERLPTIWTCKDGTKLKIKEMTDSHLMNAIRWMRRQTYGVGGPAGGGSEADDVWFEETDVEDEPAYRSLVKEAKRRKLDYA